MADKYSSHKGVTNGAVSMDWGGRSEEALHDQRPEVAGSLLWAIIHHLDITSIIDLHPSILLERIF